MLIALCMVRLTALASVQPNAAPTAAARVQAWLATAPDNTMLPSTALADDVVFTGDLPGSTIRGKAEYGDAAKFWHDTCSDLLRPSYKTAALRVAALSADEVTLRWRAEWSPDSVRWLERLSSTVGWDIERFDLDPMAVSTFSWVAVAQLFRNAASTGTIRLPAACVEGLATLRFDAASGLCVSHRERVDVVSLAAARRLSNRKVAANCAEFLDIRRPLDVDSDVWAVDVAAGVLAGVPGAGPLDIEPLADEREGTLALAAFALVVVVVLSWSVGVVGDATGAFGSTPCDEVNFESAWAYSQCVADLF